MIAAAAAHWEQEEGRDYAQVEGVFIASLVPMPHHVLVRWLKRTETKGGVLIPQNRQRKSFMKGQILRVGDGCDLGLREGALIQFDSLAEKEWLGVQDPADRDPVFFMREEDIHGVLTYDSERKVHLQPVADRALIKPDAPPTERAGLVLPAQNGKILEAKTGTLLAIGHAYDQDRRHRDLGNTLSLAIGKRVAYSAMDEIMLDGEMMHLAKMDSVLAVLED